MVGEPSMSSAGSSSSSSSPNSRSPSRSSSPTTFEPPQQLLDTYQSVLLSTFDLTGLLPTQPQNEDEEDEVGKTMTKAEKQNAKKKRRKEREREAKLAESSALARSGPSQPKCDTGIGFRLFSSCPIQSVKLEEQDEEYTCPLNPRHRILTEEEKAINRTRAEASAVASSNLGGPSTIAERWTRVSRQPRTVVLTNPTPIDQGVAIVQVDLDGSGMVTPSSGVKNSKTIPLIPVQSTVNNKARVRRGRSGRKKVERPPAKYWRPKGGLGGKSQSTIWGYGVGMPVKGR